MAGRPNAAGRRTRSPPTAATCRLRRVAARARARRRRRSAPRRSSTSSAERRAERRGARRRSPASSRRSACCTASWRPRACGPTTRPPTSTACGCRRASPSRCSEARGRRSLLDAVIGNEPGRTGATGRCSSCSTPPGRGSPRRVGLSLGDLDLDGSPRAAVRQGIEGAHRAVRTSRRGGAGGLVLARRPGALVPDAVAPA